MPEEIRAKGSAFLGVIRSLESLKGLAFQQAVFGDLQGECGEAVRTKTVLASGWYPIAWYRDILQAADRRAANASFLREVGRASTRDTISTIHRIFMRAISTETLIKQGTRVFSSYYTAETRVEVKESRRAHVIWSGCYGFDRCCWQDQLGSVEMLMELAGEKESKVALISGGGDRDATMVAEVSWR